MSAEHIVSVSSGAASAYTWQLVVDVHGAENVVGLFADVNGEDADNYRFLAEVHAHIGGELVTLDNGGRTIWDSMREARFLSNTRVDSCSRVLKREPIMAWLKENAPGCCVYLGIDWTEEHRLGRSVAAYAEAGMTCRAPMVERTKDKADAIKWLDSIGILPPALTREGFPHANCRGGCVKSGAKQFKRLLRTRPDDYAWWEKGEADMRDFLGGDIAILRDRRDGTTKPLTLTELRLLSEAQPSLFDDDDQAACGCFTAEVSA